MKAKGNKMLGPEGRKETNSIFPFTIYLISNSEKVTESHTPRKI